MNKTQNWMVDENNTLIGPNGNISVSWRGEIPPCPEDAICSVGMDNGLVLIILFAFFLGMLGGWAMKHVVSKEERKKDANKADDKFESLKKMVLTDPSWDKGATIEGVHEYTSNCEVYGCDGQHV
tara:strand:- start:1413 stop:1787 length:375 start_codon:yes stop_codon:yes gene_type:complete